MIITTDTAADPDMKFTSLAALIRYARIDLGVRIDIKVEPLRRKVDGESPHESTADQFFDETQFEVYRTLGEHITRKAFESESAIDVLKELAT